MKKIKYYVVGGIVLICAFLYFSINITIHSEKIELEYGNKVSYPKATISFLGFDLTDYLVIEDDINYDKIGNYSIKYSLKYGMNIKTNELKVSIVDLESPKIVLADGNLVITNKDNVYDFERNYAEDNYDENPTIEIYESDLNIEKEGLYRVVFQSHDSSGNVSYQTQFVIVDNEISQNMFMLSEYDLNTMDVETMKYHDWELSGINMLNYYFVGDSIIGLMTEKAIVNPRRAIAIACLAPSNVETRKCKNNYELTDKTASELIAQFSPDNIIINFGLCDIEVGSIENFFKNYDAFVTKVVEIVPDANIYIASVIPVTENTGEEKPSNISINIYNYYLCKYANEKGFDFINVAEALMGEDGFGVMDYYHEDGYHLSDLGQNVYITYLKHRL